MVHELAGKPVPKSLLADIPRILSAYHASRPDITKPAERVSFGTSGHRGSSLKNSFNEDHILAVSQAVSDYRRFQNITGPLFLGMDTHALSKAALITALEVLAANRVTVKIQKGLGYTPTPVISHAILTYNRGKTKDFADGIVITPSHNPPEDGGYKYNPPHGGPADTDVTRWIEERANLILAADLKDVKRMPYEKAAAAQTTQEYDYLPPYIADLENVIDLKAVAGARIKIGVDPLGGAAVDFWDPIAARYGLNLEVVNREVDPAFGFMTADRDGKIRMDCSSPYAMAGLVGLKDRFDVAFGNDTDADRHGIVTKTTGLLNPNHYLSVAVSYLFRHRPLWKKEAAVGKTLVSSAMIDRVCRDLGRRLCEVPVGFKWFVGGLLEGSFGFGGEESAGASFLRKDGTVWTTDKDGIIMGLLACEMMARTGKDSGVLYEELKAKFGDPVYERIDVAATSDQKKILGKLSPESVTADRLAGEPILTKLTRAPGNQAPVGGLKVVTENGWFAARPSGTEDIYKIYAESFKGKSHLDKIKEEAQAIVDQAFQQARAR